MTNLEVYNSIFCEVFAVDKEQLIRNFTKETVDSWDSVHQLNIASQMEESFDLFFEPEDIMMLTSYEAGKELLRKYEIDI